MPYEQSADEEFHSFWKCMLYQYGIIYSLAVRFRLSGFFATCYSNNTVDNTVSGGVIQDDTLKRGVTTS